MAGIDDTSSWHYGPLPSTDDAPAWIFGIVPDGWIAGMPEVSVDRDEMIIICPLPAPDHPGDATESDRAATEEGRISRFREATRDMRVQIAQQLQYRYHRQASWGARCGATTMVFTHQSIPVTTRLRQPERLVLDTLVGSGVAASRSDALAWCVRLVEQHAEDWLKELREAMLSVDDLRRRGPAV
ncbi:hypothetical protein [Glycomyces tenuis]|uniref:hypothetical protein n=1 Tax=Glycomyces tenuis TaxID=58116 RepID=UPI0003F7510F|nr:hypothetical protein [Glycomyces tenuis]